MYSGEILSLKDQEIGLRMNESGVLTGGLICMIKFKCLIFKKSMCMNWLVFLTTKDSIKETSHTESLRNVYMAVQGE